MREAPALVIIEALLQAGASVSAYDPVAMAEGRRILGDRSGLVFADRAESAIEGADALLLVTEWKEFKSPDFFGIKAALKTPVIFDGRNQYDPVLMKSLGLEHYGIGR